MSEKSRKARKIQLSIKADSSNSYLPDWTEREGIREIIQNARDAELELNAPMVIEWYQGTTGRETLRITNEGCNIPRESLLFGHTSKLGKSELIGRFGEGLKLGILALVRAGLKVRLFTGNDEDKTGEIWIPEIEKSETFNADVLTINIKDAVYRKRVRIEIEGISRNDWETQYKYDYLFLPGVNKGKVIKTASGEILLEPVYQNKIYVKGIFVQRRTNNYGYNFFKAELDRDRKMVDWYSYETNKALVIKEAVESGQLKPETFLDMLETTANDVSGYSFPESFDTKAAKIVADEFKKKHGESAIPFQSSAEIAQYSHLDPAAKPIIVSQNLGKILSKVYGTFDELKKKVETEVVKTHDIDSLEIVERKNLMWGVAMTNIALNDKINIGTVTVCDYRNPTLLGQFLSSNGQIRIAKKILQDRNETLATIVHEIAHKNGLDGEVSHIAAIENIWSKIVGALTKDVELEN